MTVGAQPLGSIEGTSLFDDAEAVDLRRLLNTLWRRKMIVMGTTLVLTSIALLIVMQLTPLYVAETEIVVQPPDTNVIDIEKVAQGLSTDFYTNDTEAAILGSRAIASEVVDRLDLVNHPAFNPALSPPRKGLLDRLHLRELIPEDFDPLALIPESWRTAIRDFRADDVEETEPPEPLTPEEEQRLLREDAIDTYLGGLSVTPSESSRVITVSFTSPDPELAAQIANAAAQAYIDDQVRAKTDETSAANVWLQDRAVQLKETVAKAAAAVEQHRRKSGLVSVGGTNLLAKQIAELNSQLIIARAARAEAEARFNQVQKLLKSKDGIDSAAAVLQSSLIQRLREQEAEVVRKIAEMKTQFREGHPKMILARSELQDLVDKIGNEVGKIATNLGNELEIALVREKNLDREIAKLQRRLDDQADAEITLHALETDLEANRKLYDTILARLKETGVQNTSLMQADARIISAATVPYAPSYPRKRLIVGIAFVGSTVLGVLIVLLIEHLDSGFRSREQLEAATGVATLSIVPRLRGRRMANTTLYDDILERPHTVFSESLRTLRTSLLLSNVDEPPRTVLVTSSIPSEGKSSTALALARTVAKYGKKCIIIDADLRSPSVHGALGVPNNLGLIDYLSRDVALEDMIQIDFKSGAHFIVAGPAMPHPADLLGSDKMRGLLASLREIYDLVVIDTPPVLAMSDPLVLMRFVDKTIYLVRWEKTPRDTAIAGIRQVLDAGANLAGLVLSQVDLRKHATYHYADSGYLNYHGYGDEPQSQSQT
ncbi:MAG: GumC family protein [Alphaproteobacteria bacterium]